MRFHRRRRLGWTGGAHVDGDLALEVEPGQLVPMGLGNHQPVAGEDHGGFEFGREVGARAESGIGAEGERLFLAVADQREAGLFLHQLPRLELDRLQVSGRARRFEAECPELAGDILHRLAEFIGADIAALQLVVGKELNVSPPEFPFGGVVHRGGQQRRRGEKEEHGSFEHDPYRNITGGVSSGIMKCRLGIRAHQCQPSRIFPAHTGSSFIVSTAMSRSMSTFSARKWYASIGCVHSRSATMMVFRRES